MSKEEKIKIAEGDKKLLLWWYKDKVCNNKGHCEIDCLNNSISLTCTDVAGESILVHKSIIPILLNHIKVVNQNRWNKGTGDPLIDSAIGKFVTLLQRMRDTSERFEGNVRISPREYDELYKELFH